MFTVHNVFISFLAVVLSFLLFGQGEDYNINSNPFGHTFHDCQVSGECEYRGYFDQDKIKAKYGKSYSELEAEFRSQSIFEIVPVTILIVTIFVSFTIDKHEVVFVTLVLVPYLISFLFRLMLPEFFLAPVYLIFAAIFAAFFSYFKRWLYVRTP